MPELDPILRTRLSKYLTSEILDALPDSEAFNQALQRLNTLHRSISSFLPSYIAENEQLLTRDYYGSLTEGTFLFADVSGFTALSEKLMQKAGADGIEVLTKIFNDYFSTMLEILAKSEGQLLKFAGDALLTFFPAEAGKDKFPKAVKTGLRMQRAMREDFQPIQNEELKKWFGKQHDLSLTMSIGLAHGKLFEALVGNLAQRDHIIMGSLPGRAMAAEEAGERDEVIIDSQAQQHYQHLFETLPLENGFYRVVDNFGDDLGDYEFSMPPRRRAKSSFLFGLEEVNALTQLEAELARLETIARFVSSEIVNRLVVKGDHIESENRLATVIFVHFTGFAEMLEVWGEDKLDLVTLILSRYYGIMQRVVASHGGVITRSDPYKLGSKLLITFGAPVAHPDDPDRAVETCLDMNRQLETFNNRLRDELPQYSDMFPFVKQRMGVTQGDVYAGEVGWRQRREYTVMGDEVNLAARLMSKAEFGEVWISQNVWERVNHYFKTEPLPPFTAKGKAELIHAYRALASRKDSIATTSDTPFVGRDVALLSLNMVLQQAQRGLKKVRSVGLYGDIGVGKTRLAKQLAHTARSSGFKVAWATCRFQNTRRATWSAIVSQLIDLDSVEGREAQQAKVKATLEALELLRLEDVFNDLLFGTLEIHKKIPSRAQRKAISRARINIFDRLADTGSLELQRDDQAAVREQVKAALRSTTTADLLNWAELQLGTSLTEALIAFLEAYTRNTPTLIVIDDLHKEHPRALHILKRIVREISGARLMIVATYEPFKDSDLDMHKVAVADLPEEQAYLLATTILEASELGERLSKFLWESTSGRALFVESLIQALIEADALERNQGVVELKSNADTETLPDNVRGLVISRVDRLSSDARAVLRAAAVLGETFSEKALRFVSEIESDAVFAAVLEELLKLQMFEEHIENRYRFRHGVTQQALYEEMTRLQRQKIHLRVADYYTQQEDSEHHLMSAAHHLVKAGALDRARAVVTQAAQRAEGREDLGQAVELYTRGLEIFPDDEFIQEQLARLQAD